jgi:hypothetical protein
MLPNTIPARIFLTSILAVSMATASAVEIYDAQGFEAPLFTEGALHLQDGWLTYNLSVVSTEIVPSTHPSGGDQMVRFTHREWGSTVDAVKELNDAIEDDSVVSLSLDMRLDETWFAGVDSDAEYRAGVAMDFDSAAGYVPAFMTAAIFGDGLATPYAGKQGYYMIDNSFIEYELDSEWHRIGLTYDNATGQIMGSVDDVILLTSYVEPGSVTEVLNIAFASFRFAGGEDTAYADFDELTVSVAPSAVPEPGTAIVLSLGALALLRRRRLERKASRFSK